MKMWCYEDQEGLHYVSEDTIIAEYWSFWYPRMVKKYGAASELITRENCIRDWVTTHWAREKNIEST